jgi:hypothetical protein
MTRIKVFVNKSQREIEATVNKWLESQASIQVKQVLQSIDLDNNDIPWVTLTIVYVFSHVSG